MVNLENKVKKVFNTSLLVIDLILVNFVGNYEIEKYLEKREFKQQMKLKTQKELYDTQIKNYRDIMCLMPGRSIIYK